MHFGAMSPASRPNSASPAAKRRRRPDQSKTIAPAPTPRCASRQASARSTANSRTTPRSPHTRFDWLSPDRRSTPAPRSAPAMPMLVASANTTAFAPRNRVRSEWTSPDTCVAAARPPPQHLRRARAGQEVLNLVRLIHDQQHPRRLHGAKDIRPPNTLKTVDQADDANLVAENLRYFADAMLESQTRQFRLIDDDRARLGQQRAHFRSQIAHGRRATNFPAGTNDAAMRRTTARFAPKREFIEISLDFLDFRLRLESVQPCFGNGMAELDAGTPRMPTQICAEA